MMNYLEMHCAAVATRVIAKAGGEVSFDQYDQLMGEKKGGREKVIFFAPINWCEGWGNPRLLRLNQEKLCVFAAVRAGFVMPIPGGYRLCCCQNTLPSENAIGDHGL